MSVLQDLTEMEAGSKDMKSPKTLLYFPTTWAFIYGILMCVTGTQIYDSAPKLYASMSVYPQYAWGSVSLVIGVFMLITKLKKLRLGHIAASFAYCLFMSVLTLNLYQTSLLGAAFYVLFAIFLALHTAELVSNLRKN